jgi:hypothetical protein
MFTYLIIIITIDYFHAMGCLEQTLGAAAFTPGSPWDQPPLAARAPLSPTAC